jgi:Zn-finger nucleic acid-binding protein
MYGYFKIMGAHYAKRSEIIRNFLWNKKVDLYYREKIVPKEELEQIVEINKQLENISALKKSTTRCPECKKPFHLVMVGEVEIDVCQLCKSYWFDEGELKEVVEAEKDIPSDNLTSRASRYACPKCELQMIEHVYKKPDNLLVDRCPACRCVYLEKNELERSIRSLRHVLN